VSRDRVMSGTRVTRYFVCAWLFSIAKKRRQHRREDNTHNRATTPHTANTGGRTPHSTEPRTHTTQRRTRDRATSRCGVGRWLRLTRIVCGECRFALMRCRAKPYGVGRDRAHGFTSVGPVVTCTNALPRRKHGVGRDRAQRSTARQDSVDTGAQPTRTNALPRRKHGVGRDRAQG